MHDLLFEKQDSLGLKSWGSFATEVGLKDTTAFARCIRLPVDSFPRIGAGLELGRRNGVRGTPTLWINGHRIDGGVSLEVLRRRVARGGKPK
jgi:protein-disulfide isomerase